VAVNLTGLDLSGTAAKSAHKPSAPNASTHAAPRPEATQQAEREVSVSSTASLLSNVQRSLSSTPAIDQKRVESIRNALASGTYKVDSDRIAHGLIDSERVLGKLK
jgi:negative regulator of flagellin synthesis FlgM